MKDALAIHRWLLAHQVHHEIVRLPRTLTCAAELPEVLRAAPADCLEVSIYEADTRVAVEAVAVVASVSTPPRPGLVCTAIGARRVRPASAFMVNAVTEYAAGLVCPLLLPEDLTVLIDERLFDDMSADRTLHTPTGERRTALSLRAPDLLKLVSGKRLDLTPRSRLPLSPIPRKVHPLTH